MTEICVVLCRCSITESFEVRTGVGRGCIFTPLLFMVLIDFVLAKAIFARLRPAWRSQVYSKWIRLHPCFHLYPRVREWPRRKLDANQFIQTNVNYSKKKATQMVREHLARMSQGCIPHVALNWTPSGKRMSNWRSTVTDGTYMEWSETCHQRQRRSLTLLWDLKSKKAQV